MKPLDILNAASKGYPDEYMTAYYEIDNGREIPGASGDTLALFLVREIREVMSEEVTPQQNISSAVRALELAQENIQDVIDALLNIDIPEEEN